MRFGLAMRWVVAAFAVGVGVCSAQVGVVGTERDGATAALEHGRLVIWIVHPAVARWNPDAPVAQSPVTLPKTVQEATVGEFGNSSSNVGQTAGSYGQSAGSLGKAASDVGTASSNVGTGPGRFGRAASDVGQSAGSYGQTAGSYGESLGSIATAGAAAGVSSRLSDKHSAQWEGVVVHLRGDLQGLEVVMKDVHEEDLVGALKETAGSPDAPDVLLGSPLPWMWKKAEGGRAGEWVLGALGVAAFPVQVEDGGVLKGHGQVFAPEIAILANAPHPERARAFAVWLSDGGICRACGSEPDDWAIVPAKIAVSALRSVLAGGGVGSEADVDLAKQDADAMRRAALMTVVPLDNLKTRIDIVHAEANDRLAVVELRATASVDKAFGVLHSVVVLRRNAGGKWKVLQMTPNLSAAMQRDAAALVGEFCKDGRSAAKVLGISQASPPEGDVRSYKPDLWWDNLGGASMQIIEWQQGYGETWTGTRMYFVPDRDPHLRTRVTAEFAAMAGLYRWRVWSVGSGGVVVLSGWKTLEVQGTGNRE